MSVVVMVKVFDGIVLAADSALSVSGAEPNQISHVYHGGTKLFCLHRGLALGAATWGLGNIGSASLAALMKDFRASLTREDADFKQSDYTVEDVTKRLRSFLYEDHYAQSYGDSQAHPQLGVAVAGYSVSHGLPASQPELWEFAVDEDGQCAAPRCCKPRDVVGVDWRAMIVPVHRFYMGFDPRLSQLLAQGIQPPEAVPRLLQQLAPHLEAPLVTPAMPILDAIEVAEFLVNLTAFWEKFTPGPPLVGGAVELAVITKHERFKWVRRKHYYTTEFNPPTLDGDDLRGTAGDLGDSTGDGSN